MGKKKKEDKKTKAIPQAGNLPLQGSQRSLATSAIGSIRRRYDLEILENPIRDAGYARELIEMVEYCYEVRHTLSVAADDTFASSDGDDQGFTIADTLDDNETLVNPEIYAIALDLIERQESHEKKVIGGDTLKKAIRWALAYGDCFLEVSIEKEGIGRNDYGVARSLYLPTWEMFRTEDDQGYLEGFEQRRRLSQSDPDYTFFPFQIVHFRHEPRFLYGDSLFKQSIDSWGNLKEATANLADAARDLGINPNLHIMPEGASVAYVQDYKQHHEQESLRGMVSNYYLYSGQDVRKLANINANLTPLIESLLQWRYRMIPAGFPVWMFPGLQTVGAREISQEPSKLYSRKRHTNCQLLTKGIKQLIDTEIILKKGYAWWRENSKYRIIWSKWSLDGMIKEDGDDESDATGIADLEQDNGRKNGKASRLQYVYP